MCCCLTTTFIKIWNNHYNIFYRTQEQLGYRVRAEKTKADGVLALLVLVQSHMEPEFVNQRIESFLTSFVVSYMLRFRVKVKY